MLLRLKWKALGSCGPPQSPASLPPPFRSCLSPLLLSQYLTSPLCLSPRLASVVREPERGAPRPSAPPTLGLRVQRYPRARLLPLSSFASLRIFPFSPEISCSLQVSSRGPVRQVFTAPPFSALRLHSLVPSLASLPSHPAFP